LRCTIPEGVEVKLSAELIRPLVIGKTTTVFSMYGRYQKDNPEGLNTFKDKSQVLDVKTKGKFMYWTFENEWYMFCTFGMSGQWSPTKGKHPALGIEFTDGSEVWFNDPRHFGTIKFVRGKDKLNKKLYELGWDPLTQERAVHQPYVTSVIQLSNKPIGQILMDQKVFAGVGNYIRAEALYQVKLSPWRRGNMLTKSEIEALCIALIEVMQESYQHQGATISTYATPYGDEGKYSGLFKVYGQKQDPLGNPIIKEETPEGRTIHWCPMIQK
jgi:DNA-formamidopyrimidine glycosylase